MKILTILLIGIFLISSTGIAFSRETDENGDNSTGNALGSALMGGLLGAGLGAAIGSASGKAGTGAAIGAGVGALGGTLIGAEKARNEKARAQQEQEEQYIQDTPKASQDISTNTPIKKKIVREYDQDGNVISEKEVR